MELYQPHFGKNKPAHTITKTTKQEEGQRKRREKRERDKKIKRIEREREIIMYIHTHIPSGLVHEHRKPPHSVSDSAHRDPQLHTVHAQLIAHNHSYHRNDI